MDTIKINVAEYYGIPSYYSVMPTSIFDALELAYLKGLNIVSVAKADFDKMVTDYKIKMGV